MKQQQIQVRNTTLPPTGSWMNDQHLQLHVHCVNSDCVDTVNHKRMIIIISYIWGDHTRNPEGLWMFNPTGAVTRILMCSLLLYIYFVLLFISLLVSSLQNDRNVNSWINTNVCILYTFKHKVFCSYRHKNTKTNCKSLRLYSFL